MGWMAAIPLAMSAAQGIAGAMGGKKDKKDAGKASAEQVAMAQQMIQQQMAQRDQWGNPLNQLLSSGAQAWMQGKRPEVISGDLQSARYADINRTLDEKQRIANIKTTQDLEKRGLATSGIYGKSKADLNENFQRARLQAGLELQKEAALVNQQAAESEINRLIGGLGNAYSGASQLAGQALQYGTGLMSDAKSATLAAAQKARGAVAGGLGAIGGGFMNAFTNGLFKKGT